MRWNEHCIRPFPQNSSHEISGAHGKTRLSRLSKRCRKEPQDISKHKAQILMPFHPPLNHDVYNHMDKIQPILSARFRVPPRSFFDSKSHSKLSARDGRRKDREPIVPVMYSAFATFWRRWPSTTTETFTPHRQGGGGPFVELLI